MMFIDANALLGDPVSDLYGANGAEAMNGAGYIFQSFLEANELCIPATLGYHRGPHATWRHPRGHCLRRGHVVISSALKAVVSSFCVLSDFDGGFCHVDHWPAVLRPDRKPLRCNYDKIRDPDCIQRFQQSIQSLPVPSWEVSVGDHSKILETNIVQLAQQHFGQPSKIKQRPVLSEATLSGIKLKRQMLDMMRTCLPSDPLLVSELKAIEKILRPKVRHDQARWYDLWIGDINDADSQHDTAALYKKLTRFGRRKKTLEKGHRPLPQLRLQDGTLAQSHTQCQSVWGEQFARVEARAVVSNTQLQQLHALQDFSADRDIAVCPSPSDILRIIRKFKNGKVPGPGLLPVDVLTCGGFAIAQLLCPLLAKASWHAIEPISWKGGLLVPLFKGKGSAQGPGAYRSIFISDVMMYVLKIKFIMQESVGLLQTSGISPLISSSKEDARDVLRILPNTSCMRIQLGHVQRRFPVDSCL